MKRKIIFGLFVLLPSLIWGAQGDRLNLLIFWIDGQQCETFVLGLGVQQLPLGHNLGPAGGLVGLAVVASTGTYQVLGCNRTVRIDVLDQATLPFLSGDITEAQPYDTFTLRPLPSPPFPPGAYGWGDTLYPWRATTHQRGAYPKDILEYRFIVKDIEGLSNVLVPDTSSPLDSIIPGAYAKLLLVLPGEQHYPGDKSYIGYRGMPWDLNAGKFYDFCVYATDIFSNALPFDVGNQEYAKLEACLSTITPDAINPASDTLLTRVPHPAPDTFVDWVVKNLFKVSFPAMGYAGLKAKGIPPGIHTDSSECRHFRITGPPPDPKDQIVVIPNPCGTPGLPAVIIIRRVPIGGGEIRGKIYDSFGYLVRDFSKELMDQSRLNPFASFWRLEWDATNEKGKKVANGCYHLCVEIVQVEKAGVWKEKIGVVW